MTVLLFPPITFDVEAEETRKDPSAAREYNITQFYEYVIRVHARN